MRTLEATLAGVLVAGISVVAAIAQSAAGPQAPAVAPVGNLKVPDGFTVSVFCSWRGGRGTRWSPCRMPTRTAGRSPK